MQYSPSARRVLVRIAGSVSGRLAVPRGLCGRGVCCSRGPPWRHPPSTVTTDGRGVGERCDDRSTAAAAAPKSITPSQTRWDAAPYRTTPPLSERCERQHVAVNATRGVRCSRGGAVRSQFSDSVHLEAARRARIACCETGVVVAGNAHPRVAASPRPLRGATSDVQCRVTSQPVAQRFLAPQHGGWGIHQLTLRPVRAGGDGCLLAVHGGVVGGQVAVPDLLSEHSANAVPSPSAACALMIRGPALWSCLELSGAVWSAPMRRRGLQRRRMELCAPQNGAVRCVGWFGSAVAVIHALVFAAATTASACS